MAANRQRIKYWVSPRIQGRILMRIVGYWVAYHVILWHTMFIVRYVSLRAAQIANDGETQTLSETYEQFSRDYASVAVCAIVLAPIFLYDIFRNTHRIAGPLVRFQNALKRITQGERVEPFLLRKRDLLTEFNEVFNEFLEFYNRKLDQQAPAIMSDRDAAIVEQIEKIRKEMQDSGVIDQGRISAR